MHRNSRLIFERYARPHFRSHTKVLEIGPTGSPSMYQQIIDDATITWETLDICDGPKLTYPNTPAYAFPIPDDTYDIVLSGQVLEHVPKVWVWIGELARICRPGGHVITINPVSWPYHRAPVDCWRAFPDGMRALYEHAGLEVETSTFESIEGEGIRRTIPGRGLDRQRRIKLVISRLLAPLGFPVECAYDTITIGRKPAMTTTADPDHRAAA